MTGVYLIDKSVLARMVCNVSVREAIEALDEAGTLAACSIIDLEIGYSARDLSEFDDVVAVRRELYQELPITRAVTDRARGVQRELVKRGHHRGPGVADLLIAAAAELHGAEVIHYDRDFETIGVVTGQPTRWVVPPGSVP